MRVAPEALVPVGLELRLLLLKLLLFPLLPLAPSTFLSLQRRDGGLASFQTKRLRNYSSHKRGKHFQRYHLCHVEGLQLPPVFCEPLSLQLLSPGEHPVGLFPGLVGFMGFSFCFFVLLFLFLPLVKNTVTFLSSRDYRRKGRLRSSSYHFLEEEKLLLCFFCSLRFSGSVC